MRTQRLSQRLLAWLLALATALACTPAASAEDSARATVMRLQKTEGTVNISDGSEKSVSVRDGLRLYNGYHLETEEASYAWINLDDDKLVKMDAVSEISLRKSGRKLDVLVDSGNLFFDVSKPLEDDESLNIRTSTMVVDIRGTSGWVKVADQWTTRAYILEGTVRVSVTDPVTGETKAETVRGGEAVTCKVYPQDKNGTKCDIIRQTFTEDDVEGFTLVDLVQDRPLREKIREGSGLEITDSADEADRKLKDDQEAVRKKLEEIDSQLEGQEHDISRDPVWSNPGTSGTTPSKDDDRDGGSSSGGSGSSGGSSSTPAPAEDVTLTMPVEDDTVDALLQRQNVRSVTLLPGTARASTASMLEVDSGITVPAGKALTLETGVGMTILAGQRVAVGESALVRVGGTCAVMGTIAPSRSASVKALRFDLTAQIPDWTVSETADSQGYYSLEYAPGETYTVSFDAAGGTVTPAASPERTASSPACPRPAGRVIASTAGSPRTARP